MKQWKHGTVVLACDELREKIAGKRIALMMNTSVSRFDRRYRKLSSSSTASVVGMDLS